jgi:hypothetical protein
MAQGTKQQAEKRSAMSGLPGQGKHYASKRGASYCGAKEWRREAGAIESDELVQGLPQREDAAGRVGYVSYYHKM